MAFIYETYGPFDVERDSNKLRKSALDAFWKDCNSKYPGLSGAVGVYIVAVKAKANAVSKPWYVGKTDKQGFQKRFSQQLNHFGDILDKAKNGTVQVFLIARRTPNRGAFMKTRSTALRENNDLETMMIGSCLKRNRSLINDRKVKHLKEIEVPGYLNNGRGKMHKAASELNRMVKEK